MILSFITRFIWPKKGNNRTWIAFSIDIEQELLNISFFYISNLSIYDYRIYWKSVKHFVFFSVRFFNFLMLNNVKAIGILLIDWKLWAVFWTIHLINNYTEIVYDQHMIYRPI